MIRDIAGCTGIARASLFIEPGPERITSDDGLGVLIGIGQHSPGRGAAQREIDG
jgi:hypothetical protein